MNLLTDSLLPVRTRDGAVISFDLPGLLAAYALDGVADLPFLRRHQEAPWHCFLAQLAAVALQRSGQADIPDDPDAWRSHLRALTEGWPDDEPWRLVVEDIEKPAFMQPPVPAGTADPHRSPVETADDLDVLVTSKNHGLKQGIGGEASIEAWIVALVMLQTCSGFLGSGNYGIARMNGGFATRPFIGLLPAGGIGAHWQRDVTVMLKRRDWFFEQIDGFQEKNGAALLWCLPWDGETSLGVDALDPWFIEVCRRVRLYRDDQGSLSAKTGGSKAARIAAKELKGRIGDPWIPIDLGNDSAAYNKTPRYDVMSKVLFDRGVFARPLLLDWHEELDPDVMQARFDVLVRGQGVTEGFYRREVVFEKEKRLRYLQSASERDRLAKLSEEMLETIKTLRNKVLKPALLTLIQSGPERVDYGDKTASAWADQWLRPIDGEIEPVFFDHLFARADDDANKLKWIGFLGETASIVFEQAKHALPITGQRRIKAIAVAESRMGAGFRSQFDDYLRPVQEKEIVNG